MNSSEISKQRKKETIKKREILEKVERKEWEFRCINVGVCPHCGGDLDKKYVNLSRWCAKCETLWLEK